MGVQNLWSLLKPTSKPIRIETLSGQRLAVDASIWLHQFLKAMRDSKGNPLQSAHIVGFLRRICKLLFHGIKPVFVFDGGASRRVKRQKAQESLEKTAQRVLDAQLKLQALQSIEGSHHIDLPSIPVREVVDDEYHLPDTYVRPKSILDPRLATEGELMDFISSQSSNIDFSKVDINSTDFQSLSAELQHEIILTLKNQSRLPNQRRVQQMLESSTSAIDFSTAQIKNMIHRATLTDRYYHLNKGGALQKRVAGSRQRDFVLIKKDGGVGGWELGNGAAAIKVVDGLEGLVGFNSKKKPNGSTKSTKSFENGLKLKDYALEEKYDDSVVGDFVDNFVDDSIVGDFVDDFVDDSVPFREILEKFKLLQDRKVIQDSIADKLNQHNGLEKYLDEDSAGGESEHSKWLKRWSNRVPQSFKIAYPTFDKIISLDILEKSFLALKELIKILERRVQQSGHDYDLFYLEFVQDALIEKTKLVVVMDGSDLSDDSDQDEVFEIIDQPCSVRATYEVDDHALKAHDYSAMKGSIPFQLFDDDSCSDDETESKIKCKESDKMDTSPQISHANNKDTNLDAPKESSEVNTNYYVIPQDNITSKFSTTIHTSPNTNQPYFDDGINSTNLSIDLIEKKADTHVTCSSQVKKLVTPCIESCQPFEDSENIIKCRISTESIFSKQDEGPISMPMPEEFDLKNDFERTSLPVLCDDEPFSDDNASNCSGLSFEEIRAKNVMEQDVKNIDVPGLDMAEVIGYFKDLDTTNIADSIDKTQTELINLYEQQRRDMRDMGDVTITMVKETQELLKLFGIPWIVAPMEAESQCAFLLLHKLVDGIITDDSDVFLFGGSSVYKNFFDSKQYVEKFEMSSIAELGLEREQLIQLAYLLGSDYSVGVKGLGPVSGVEIVNSWSSSDLSGLKAWKEWVFDLKNNVASKDDEDTRKKLRNKCRKVDLAETFPNAHIFDAYIRPTVNESKQEFTWGNPQLELLKAFLTFKLGWPEEKIDPILIPVIKEMFQKRNERQPTMKDFFPNIPTLHKSKRVQNATRGGRKKSRRL